MVAKTRITGRASGDKLKKGRPKKGMEDMPTPRAVRREPDPYECVGVFPTNEERIKYRDEMASRNYL